MKLRPYQERCIEGIDEALALHNSTLVVMPTGTGKTVVFGHVIKEWMKKGRVMVIAHREELIQQAAQKIYAITGVRPEIEKAEQWAQESEMLGKSPVIVSSVQTQQSRMKRFYPSDFVLLVIDEAHHAPADSYLRMIEHYEQNESLKILGVTATPDRHDEEALGRVFESVAMDYGIVEAIDDGWLVPIQQHSVAVEIDFSACRTVAGDLNGRDLSNVLEFEGALHEIAGPTMEICTGKTLVFAASVAHAERLAEIFNRHEPDSARFVCGTTKKDERSGIFEGYMNGEFKYLVNVGVATEGFDCPGIEFVAVARPTKSRPLYAQMIGRGTRPLPGLVDGIERAIDRKRAISESDKSSLVVLDFVGNSGQHKLISTADVLGGNYTDTVIEAAQQSAERQSKPVDMVDELVKAKIAQRQVDEAEERRRRRSVKAKTRHKTQSVDPFDVLHIQPAREHGWAKGKPASPKMVDCLERWGIKDPADLGYTKARQLIGTLIKRREDDKCTFKQAKLLKKFNYDPDMSFGDAQKTIDNVAANGWKRPNSDVHPAPAQSDNVPAETECPF